MGRPSDPSLRGPFLVLLLAWALLLPGSARSVVISFADGTANTTLPTFSGWDYVGEVNGLTATYLGDGWVITAGHVGAGDLTLDGFVYPLVSGSEQAFDNGGAGTPDLLMFAVYPHPGLPLLALRSTAPNLGEFALLIGCGQDRGAETSYDPAGALPPPPIDGWGWLGTRTKRWGTNEIDGFPGGLVNGTVALYTRFDEQGHSFESQGANGDSGGALFTLNPVPELAGVLYAVGPANGQPANTSLYTNLTFAARIDFYYDQIQDVLALPEPSGGLGWGLALLALLGRRAHRSQK